MTAPFAIGSARRPVTGAVLAASLAVLVACTAATDPVDEVVPTPTPPPDLTQVTCADYLAADVAGREAIEAQVPSMGPEIIYTAEYVLFGPDVPNVLLPNGDGYGSIAEFFTWACDGAGSESLADVLDGRIDNSAPSTCADYIALPEEVRAMWRGASQTFFSREAYDPATVETLCSSDPDEDASVVLRTYADRAAELRARGFEWSGGPIAMTDADGYTADVTFSAELSGFGSDITEAKPGETVITFTMTQRVEYTNTTPDRRNLSVVGLAASPVFPIASDICRVMDGRIQEDWAWIASEFLWNTGDYCLPWFDPTLTNPFELAPGESRTTDASSTWQQVVAEADLPAVMQALQSEGSMLWVAYFNPVSAAAAGDEGVTMPFSTGCTVWVGGSQYPVVAVSAGGDLEDCPLNIQ